MGPVTRTGCGALCPAFGTACYGCYGPAEDSNTQAFGQALAGLGLAPDQVARRFALINVDNETWRAVHDEWQSVAKDNCDGKIETTDPDP